MKVKIIDSNLEDYNKEFKLRRMNYDQVVVNYPDSKGIRVFNKDSVEFITEIEIDEFVIVAPRQTSIYVRNPAALWRLPRSIPINPPKNNAIINRRTTDQRLISRKNDTALDILVLHSVLTASIIK